MVAVVAVVKEVETIEGAMDEVDDVQRLAGSTSALERGLLLGRPDREDGCAVGRMSTEQRSTMNSTDWSKRRV
jgi:hypothetical protein